MNLSRENTSTSPMRNSTNSTLSETRELDAYAEYRASIVIWKVVPPILIVLGTAGNILSILVLTRKAIRISTTAFLLTVLAFSDLVVLYIGLFRHCLMYGFGIDLRLFSEVGCKMVIWLIYCFVHFSSWVLTLVTLERVIAVWLPLRVKSICTQRNASVSVVTVGVFLLLLNSHMLYGFGLVYSGENVQCDTYDHEYSRFFYTTWAWIDICTYGVIPCALVITGNVFILIKIIKSRNYVSKVNVSTNRPGRNSHMTTLLFTLSAFFLFTTLPVSIYSIWYTFSNHWARSYSAQSIARMYLWWAIVNMLSYCNNVFNFLLYCITGTKFRKELIRILCP